ncbi:hypothetical protein AVDCRST_MAG94-7072 [uncultured Leptolyngbya sp.]|uniref:Uncharacterized protein n=1 Tax=uncultured Leptolyngbya sp. TaxID=332963 RepID=A0A6J4PXD5_9CYAN|nr:hypothetical protein AVDCRST_MAG94-7072 [uncultured Leptolyngbya sp.]
MKSPAIGSTWLNNKKQTLYRVWLIAPAVGCGEYVVYQEAGQPISKRGAFHVRHTEIENLIGLAYLEPPNDWLISWLDRPVDWEPIAWARPHEMWHSKFTAVE